MATALQRRPRRRTSEPSPLLVTLTISTGVLALLTSGLGLFVLNAGY